MSADRIILTAPLSVPPPRSTLDLVRTVDADHVAQLETQVDALVARIEELEAAKATEEAKR